MALVFTKAAKHVHNPLPPDRPLNANDRSVAKAYVTAVGVLRDSVQRPAVLAALRNGDAKAALDALNWHGWALALTEMRDGLRREILAQAAREATEVFGQRVTLADAGVTKSKAAAAAPAAQPLTKTEMRALFRALDQRAIHYAETQAGKRMLSLQTEDRAALRVVIAYALKGGMTVSQTARVLEQTVGLSDRSARSLVVRTERGIELAVRGGQSLAQAEQAASALGDAVSERQVASRAMTIARTEINTAANEGRYQAWHSGVDSGLIASDATKEWVDADGCPICAEVSGEIVGWDEEFSTGDTMPPAHPNCRCTAVLHAGSHGSQAENEIEGADAEDILED